MTEQVLDLEEKFAAIKPSNFHFPGAGSSQLPFHFPSVCIWVVFLFFFPLSHLQNLEQTGLLMHPEVLIARVY